MSIRRFGVRLADESEVAIVAQEAAPGLTVDRSVLAIDGTSAIAIGTDGRVVLIQAIGRAFRSLVCFKPTVRVVEQLQYGGRLEIDADREDWRAFRIDLQNRWEAHEVAAQLAVAAVRSE